MARSWTCHRALALLLVLGFQPVPAAEACGGFFSRSVTRRASLAYEQALIVYDANTSKEHFVREVTFDGADESFGFVVPTPTRPEVAKVDESPFGALRGNFPLKTSSPSVWARASAAGPVASAGASASPFSR